MNKKRRYKLIKEAIESDNRELAKHLIDSYEVISDINYQPPITTGGSLLEIAINHGQDDIACKLFDMGIKISFEITSGVSYPIIAVRNNMEKFIKKLCELEEFDATLIKKGYIQDHTFLEIDNMLSAAIESKNKSIINNTFNNASLNKLKKAKVIEKTSFILKNYRAKNLRNEAKELKRYKSKIINQLP